MSESRIAVVVEDDPEISRLITAVLKQAGFEVHVAADGPSGVDAVLHHRPVLATLDLALPGFDGVETARRIRQFSDAVIIMVTASADEPDILLAFEAGADDYITKPFRPRELRARINARLRRPVTGEAGFSPAPATTATAASASSPTLRPDGMIEHRGLLVDTRSRQVWVDGQPVELTRSEFDLLQCLLENAPVVLAKADLVRKLRHGPDAPRYVTVMDERALEVHMTNLRRKLGDDAKNPRWLRTVRGVGYTLA